MNNFNFLSSINNFCSLYLHWIRYNPCQKDSLMTRVTLNNVGSLIDATTAQTTINNNNTTIQTAFDNTLSRDGTQPNTMLNTLDMNGNQLLNLPAPSTVNSPARLIDVVSNPTITI